MEKSTDTIPDSLSPLEELRRFVERLEREEAIRKAEGNQRVMEAASRWALGRFSDDQHIDRGN